MMIHDTHNQMKGSQQEVYHSQPPGGMINMSQTISKSLRRQEGTNYLAVGKTSAQDNKVHAGLEYAIGALGELQGAKLSEQRKDV